MTLLTFVDLSNKRKVLKNYEFYSTYVCTFISFCSTSLNSLDLSLLISKMPSKQRKIAMMGYRSVGKSSLIIQFVEGQFVDSYDPTIENTFTKFIRLNSTEYEVKLVDTAGQDEYSIFPLQYSMDFHGYVLVYSITSSKSFQIVQIIYDKLLDMIGKIHVPIVLVGNKTDLHLERKISTEEGKRLAEKWKAAFVETSAKRNESVTDMFHAILSEIERSDGHIPDKNGCVVS